MNRFPNCPEIRSVVGRAILGGRQEQSWSKKLVEICIEKKRQRR